MSGTAQNSYTVTWRGGRAGTAHRKYIPVGRRRAIGFAPVAGQQFIRVPAGTSFAYTLLRYYLAVQLPAFEAPLLGHIYTTYFDSLVTYLSDPAFPEPRSKEPALGCPTYRAPCAARSLRNRSRASVRAAAATRFAAPLETNQRFPKLAPTDPPSIRMTVLRVRVRLG